jgi:hypothetical protein
MTDCDAFNILLVAQSGRLGYEALLFAASLRAMSPGWRGGLFVATPRPGPLWTGDPMLRDPDILAGLDRLGARVVPFDSRVFGGSYLHGNKIEALATLPEGQPFVFFDSDTLVTGDLTRVPFDFSAPSASGRCTDTWPRPLPGGPMRHAIWRALYARFGLDFVAAQRPEHPLNTWRRYPYFNAGQFHGPCPRVFGDTYLAIARAIRDDPPPELEGQALNPWLDQIALPLALARLGGGPSRASQVLDTRATCHYRTFPLLYARESARTVATLEDVAQPHALRCVLKRHAPLRRTVYQGLGARIRTLCRDLDHGDERALRKRLKAHGLWMR